MKKLLLIASSNIKKKLASMLIIGLLIGFASILLYSSITILRNMDRVLEISLKNSNLADCEFLISNNYKEPITYIAEQRTDIKDSEINEIINFTSIKYSHTRDGKTHELGLAFFSIEDNPRISKNTSGVTADALSENGIILSQYQESIGAFKVGDSFYLHLKDTVLEFKVEGFSEDAMFANTMNINVEKCFVSSKMYETIRDYSEPVNQFVDYKFKISDTISLDVFEKEMFDDLYNQYPEVMESSFYAVNWTSMKYGVTSTPDIIMAIIFAFSIMLLLVILSVIYYNLKNHMEENLPNIGILKAAGYTSWELSFSMILEIFLVCISGITVGLIIGILFTPTLGNLVSSMMGVIWRIGVDPLAIFQTLAIVLVMTLTIVCILSLKYRKIFVLDALRGGIQAHSFKKNHFALSSSPFSLVTNLGLKNIFYEKRKNIIIALIVTFLTFTSCASLFIYNYFGKDISTLLKFSGIEITDIIISAADPRYGSFDPTTLEGVKSVQYGNNADITVGHKDYETSFNCDMWDDPSILVNELLVDGRLPENEKEITISRIVADEIGAKIGDIVYLKLKDKEAEFMLVGIDQKINHYGRKGIVSFDGFHRLLDSIQPAGVYINLEDGYSFEDMKPILEKEYPGASIGEGKAIVEESIVGIISVMKLTCVFFLITTLSIVFLILFMIGKSRIVEQKKQLGINKALGFTTGALIRQNLISISPTILIGSGLGIVLALFFMNNALGIMLGSFGIGKCNYPPILGTYLLVALAILIDALLVTFITSLKIRSIEPIKMIREQ